MWKNVFLVSMVGFEPMISWSESPHITTRQGSRQFLYSLFSSLRWLLMDHSFYIYFHSFNQPFNVSSIYLGRPMSDDEIDKLAKHLHIDNFRQDNQWANQIWA